MSNRAMARMYSAGGGGNYGGGGEDGGLIGNIMDLFQNQDVNGGFTVDPATQQISATPYSGHGRKGKMRANALNAQTLGPAYQSQVEGRTQMEVQKLMNQHAQELEKIKSQHAIDLGKLDSVKEAAKRLGISTEQYAGQLAEKNASNAFQQLNNEGNANDPAQNPNINKANQIGANITASRIPPNLLGGTAGPGAITATPSIPGLDFNTLKGSTKETTSTTQGSFPMKMPDGSIQSVGGHPAITEKDTAQSFIRPVDPALKAAALLQQQQSTPSISAMPDLSQSSNPWDQDYNQGVTGQGVPQPFSQVQPMPSANPMQNQSGSGFMDLIKFLMQQAKPLPINPNQYSIPGAASF